MNSIVDIHFCSELLKTITNRVARDAPECAVAATIPDLIAEVRRVSADAEQQMRSELRLRYPEIAWQSEDAADFDAAQPHWVFDPIDGAYHYLQGLPLWSASLALVQNGTVQMAWVYDPALSELFTAQSGDGAKCAQRKLSVSAKADLAAAVVGTAIAPSLQVGQTAQAKAVQILQIMAPSVFILRPMAATSLQLAYVAAGRLDAYWESGNDAADWLAGTLLVEEAGGVVSDFNRRSLSRTSHGIVAGNPSLAKAAQELIMQAFSEPAQADANQVT